MLGYFLLEKKKKKTPLDNGPQLARLYNPPPSLCASIYFFHTNAPFDSVDHLSVNKENLL